MSGQAKLYISFVLTVGSVLIANQMFLWESQDVLRYLSYLVLAVLTSRLKLNLPGVHGTLSLFAALETATGRIVGRCFARHRAREFRAFHAWASAGAG